ARIAPLGDVTRDQFLKPIERAVVEAEGGRFGGGQRKRGHLGLLLTYLNVAKTLFELKIQLSMKTDSFGRRPSSCIAPARHIQFSISCWPASSIALSGVSRHVFQSPLASAS